MGQQRASMKWVGAWACERRRGMKFALSVFVELGGTYASTSVVLLE